MSSNAAHIISFGFMVVVFLVLCLISLKLVNFIGNTVNLGRRSREFIAFGAGFFFYKATLTNWLMPWIIQVFGE